MAPNQRDPGKVKIGFWARIEDKEYLAEKAKKANMTMTDYLLSKVIFEEQSEHDAGDPKKKAKK